MPDTVLAESLLLSGVTSDIDICNLALIKLGNSDNYITSFTDSTKEERACRRFYAHVVSVVIAEFDWNCCTKTSALTAATDPTFGYDHAYDLPDDCIRILTVSEDGTTDDDSTLEWRRIGQQIYTNADSIYLTYIYNNEDVATYDAWFIQAIAVRLAIELQPSLGGNKTLNELWGEYREIMGPLQLADARETYAKERGVSEMISVR